MKTMVKGEEERINIMVKGRRRKNEYNGKGETEKE